MARLCFQLHNVLSFLVSTKLMDSLWHVTYVSLCFVLFYQPSNFLVPPFLFWSTHSSIYIHLHRIYDIYIFDIVRDVCVYNAYTYTFTCMHTHIAIFRCICHIYAIYVYTWICTHTWHLNLWSTHDRICDICTFPHNSLSTHLSLLCSFPHISSHLSIALDMNLDFQ